MFLTMLNLFYVICDSFLLNTLKFYQETYKFQQDVDLGLTIVEVQSVECIRDYFWNTWVCFLLHPICGDDDDDMFV